MAREVIIWYAKNVPPEIQSLLASIIRTEEHILPTWIHEIAVHWEPENSHAALMSTNKPYRIAHLTVTGRWLNDLPDERAETIRHEFLHVPLGPLTDWTKDLIERLVGEDDERLNEWLLKEWQERLEGATCDLEFAFRRERANE